MTCRVRRVRRVACVVVVSFSRLGPIGNTKFGHTPSVRRVKRCEVFVTGEERTAREQKKSPNRTRKDEKTKSAKIQNPPREEKETGSSSFARLVPSGDAMSMSDPKKSTNSRTEAFVTLIPSRKWSSVFPRNIAEWSSGTHRFFFRRRAVSAATSAASAAASPKSSARRSSLDTASARPCAAGQSSRRRRTTRPATLRMGTKMSTVARANPWSRGTSSWTVTRFRESRGARESDFGSEDFGSDPNEPSVSRRARANSRSSLFFASRAASSALARRSSASLCFVTRPRVRVTCATAWSRYASIISSRSSSPRGARSGNVTSA